MTVPSTQHALQRWHQLVAQRDLYILDELLADDVVFRSPIAFTPYPGKVVVSFILTSVIGIFENFTYQREFVSADGLNVVLEFSAEIGDKKLKGIDMIRFNEQGKIVDFEVMIRPKSALEALAAQMGPKMMAFLSTHG